MGKDDFFTPVPIGELLKPVGKPEVPVAKKSKFSVNSEGKLVLYSFPSCFDIMFMLPIFLCVGCCISATTKTVFDDRQQMVHSQFARGFIFIVPCFRSYKTFSYDDIGNIGLKDSNSTINDQTLYIPVIILKNGTFVQFATGDIMSEVKEDVLGLHNFIFGKNNPNYSAPVLQSLIVPADDSCCCC